jgi:hypothetical protein
MLVSPLQCGVIQMVQVPGPERYSGRVVDIGGDDLDLLECLLRIDLGQALDARAQGLLTRIVDGGLADRSAAGLSLTHAGVQRCKSLQHRVASDREAARVLEERGLPLAALVGAREERAASPGTDSDGET